MNKYRIIFMLAVAGSLMGCRTTVKEKPEFYVYIESWDRVSFSAPRIVEGKYSKWLSKDQASQAIRVNRDSFAPRAEVMLGKNLDINDSGLDSEIDEIERWLVSCGIREITFKLAMSSRMPPVLREYRNGKTIKVHKPPFDNY